MISYIFQLAFFMVDDDCTGVAEPTTQLHSPVVEKLLPHLLQANSMPGMLSGHSELVTPLPGKHTDGPRNRHNIIRQYELHVV